MYKEVKEGLANLSPENRRTAEALFALATGEKIEPVKKEERFQKV